MTMDQVQAVGPEFTAFLRPFERFFDNCPWPNSDRICSRIDAVWIWRRCRRVCRIVVSFGEGRAEFSSYCW